MTQQQLIELVTLRHPDASEGLVRELLNAAQDEFCDYTEILEKDTDITTSSAVSYTLDDRVVAVKAVFIDGEEIPRLRPHHNGDTVWQIKRGEELNVGIYHPANESITEADGTTVTVRHIYRSPRFSTTLSEESEIPSHYHKALAWRVLEELGEGRPGTDPQIVTRYHARWKDALRKASMEANKGKNGSTINPVPSYF